MNFIFLALVLIAFSCEDTNPIRDNPLDDESGVYTGPTINLLTDIANGDTLYSETFTISFVGNELVSQFRFKLDDFAWTEWTEDSLVILDYLDEGDHQITAQSRYINGDTSDVASISFIVDAVSGPSLMFYPRRHFAHAGETVMFQVLAEEVTNLMMSEIHLEYGVSDFEIISITQGVFFQNSQNSLFISEVDPQEGTIQINTALLDDDTPSINGTGSLAILEVKLLHDASATISFSGGDIFINPDNDEIQILEKINALVEVE